MTDERDGEGSGFVPFVLRYAERLNSVPSQTLRYDRQRQISQVFVDGSWVDTPDALGTPPPSTFTRVRQESADEQ
jgi:hypothetical protein